MFLFSHFLAIFSQEGILQRNYAGRKTYKMNFTVITSILQPNKNNYISAGFLHKMKFIKEFLAQGPKKGLTDAAIMLCKLNKSL